MTKQFSMFDAEPTAPKQDVQAVITILSLNANAFTKLERERWSGCYKVVWTPKPHHAASGSKQWFTVYLNDPTDIVWMGGMTMNDLADEIKIVGLIPEARNE